MMVLKARLGIMAENAKKKNTRKMKKVPFRFKSNDPMMEIRVSAMMKNHFHSPFDIYLYLQQQKILFFFGND